jgi:SAM-dependent methyltransferase
MKNQILNPSFEKSFNQKFREKRFKFFLELLATVKTDKPIKILDIGGTEIYWERMNYAHAPNLEITLLNLSEVPTKHPNFTSIKGDACNLTQFEDNHFDIVFSNSVIEHLFTKENQIKMANEVMRVGRNYYVQTPNYYFPLEPHWLFPFFQFLPFGTRVFLTRNFSLGMKKKAENKAQAVEMVDEVKLLTVNEMKNLFPTGTLYKERFLGLIKSITLYDFTSN